QAQVASAIADEIRVKLSSVSTEHRGSAELSRIEDQNASLEKLRKTSAQVNPRAYDLYLLARHFWNNQLIDHDFKAAELYQKAVEVDPTSAAAYAGLANSFIRMVTAEYGLVAPTEVMPRAKLNALKAISIDEAEVDAHVALGMFKYRF